MLEFQRAVLDSLRQPLETGTVSVARANAHVTFPARVQLIAAMNPCRCGHLGVLVLDELPDFHSIMEHRGPA